MRLFLLEHHCREGSGLWIVDDSTGGDGVQVLTVCAPFLAADQGRFAAVVSHQKRSGIQRDCLSDRGRRLSTAGTNSAGPWSVSSRSAP